MKMMRPGLFEYQIAARMKEVHEMEGCSREAYAPIVGTGFYSTVLHYDALKNEIKDGDVVVIDVAGEYGRLCSRHHPHASGQRQIHRSATRNL